MTSLLHTGIKNPAGHGTVADFGGNGNWAIGAIGMETIDYDGDECVDFVVQILEYSFQEHFQVWRGNCNGGFELVFDFSDVKTEKKEIKSALYFAVYDVNGDGRDDFFTYDIKPSHDWTTYLFIQNEDFSYTEAEMTGNFLYSLPAALWLGFPQPK